MRPRHALSLIELLIVLAILAVLVGLAVTGIRAALAAARSAQCMANLRQIGLAVVAYADDQRGLVVRSASGTASGTTFTPTQFWHGFLGPYTDASRTGGTSIHDLRMHRTVLWGCRNFRLDPTRPWYTGYGFNAWLMEPAKSPDWARWTNAWQGAEWIGNWAMGRFREFRLDALTHPSQRPLVGDADVDWMLGYRDEPKRRHPSGRNVLFVDGHVAAVPAAAVDEQVLDPTR